MRIILTQAEIEEAVEKLILEQVHVPDDMRIDIDLKATRGEEGYQAFIDIVADTAPTGGLDRSIDERVEPIKGSETLEIAQKVIDAKAQGEQPRRRGRPAGAKNKPKGDVQEAPFEAPKSAPGQIGIPAEPTAELNVSDIPDADQVIVEDPNLSASNEELIEQAEPLELPTEEPNDTVEEGVQLDPEPNSEEALAAEAASTEPVQDEEEEDYTPTPETPGFGNDVEEEKPKAPTRSLFANLGNPAK